MEARIVRSALKIAAMICLTISCGVNSYAASYRTTNFIVKARSAQFAKQVGDHAEAFRRDLAIEWLGHELPRWSDPCPITVDSAPNMGAGGATSFMFDRNQPFGWTMSVQGSAERILDSVLPHEVTHTIFATHFGGPLPRWADEGACTTVEHPVERAKQQRLLLEFLSTNRGIAFNRMFAMKEYPHDILPLYSQGHSLAQYLLLQGGKRKFIDFVGRGMQRNRWDDAIMEFYGFEDLSDLQVTWVDWVRNGSPADVDGRQMLAGNTSNRGGTANESRLASGNALASNSNTPIPQGLPGPRAARASRPLMPVPSREADRSAPTESPYRIASTTRSSSGSHKSSSWYARQKESAGSSSASRPMERGPRPQITSRPQPVEQVQEQVLQWNSSARIPFEEKKRPPRAPVRFDAPIGEPTHWR